MLFSNLLPSAQEKKRKSFLVPEVGQENGYIKDRHLDFIGIGTSRSGSTWLAEMLVLHPEVFIPRKKEIYYFNRYVRHHKNPNYSKPIEWYWSFFKEAKNYQIKGEITPAYLVDEQAPKNIYHFNPNIKIIVILRNPADRLFSVYLHLIQEGVINRISFEKFVTTPSFADVLERNFYYKYLKRYFDLFPKENIKVAFFDDLIKDKTVFLEDIQDFLGIKPFIPPSVNDRLNPAMIPKFLPINIVLYRIRAFFRKLNLTSETRLLRHFAQILAELHDYFALKMVRPFEKKPQMDEKLRKSLTNYYLNDIVKLERLSGKDLSHWKK
ncbi:MAG: sulfotransferase domain-containing protein [Candidatus Heimdallarchaeota archaeon]